MEATAMQEAYARALSTKEEARRVVASMERRIEAMSDHVNDLRASAANGAHIEEGSGMAINGQVVTSELSPAVQEAIARTVAASVASALAGTAQPSAVQSSLSSAPKRKRRAAVQSIPAQTPAQNRATQAAAVPVRRIIPPPTVTLDGVAYDVLTLSYIRASKTGKTGVFYTPKDSGAPFCKVNLDGMQYAQAASILVLVPR